MSSLRASIHDGATAVTQEKKHLRICGNHPEEFEKFKPELRMIAVEGKPVVLGYGSYAPMKMPIRSIGVQRVWVWDIVMTASSGRILVGISSMPQPPALKWVTLDQFCDEWPVVERSMG